MRTNGEVVEALANPLEARRGLRALVHPLAIFSLLVLVINDHVLKEMFGGPITGKLSDIAGAIVVPLLIATVFEHRSRRAIDFAAGATAFVLAAINTLPVADRLYEAALSVVVPSVNTMDATDLIAVPFVLVARQIWLRVHAPQPGLLAAWGRAVFVVGIMATAATSQATPVASDSGVIFLSPEEPSIDIPVEVTIEDEPAELWRVFADSEATVLGPDSEEGPSVLADVSDGAGQGTVTFRLEDPESSAEVRWNISAEGDADSCTLFVFCSGEKEVDLQVDAPTNQFVLEPVFALPLAPLIGPQLHQLEVVIPAGAEGLTVEVRNLPFYGELEFLNVEFDEIIYPVTERRSTFIPAPQGCDAGCQLDLVVSAVRRENSTEGANLSFFVANDDGSAFVTSEPVPFDFADTEVLLNLPPAAEERELLTFPIAITVPDTASFGDVVIVESLEWKNGQDHLSVFPLHELSAISGSDRICIVDEVEVWLFPPDELSEQLPDELRVRVRHFTPQFDDAERDLRARTGNSTNCDLR